MNTEATSEERLETDLKKIESLSKLAFSIITEENCEDDTSKILNMIRENANEAQALYEFELSETKNEQ